MTFSDIFNSTGLGLTTGLALIIAIGAQNAFVLRQGILGKHIGPVVAVCALSDALLIAAGVLGTGALIAAAPAAVVVLRFVGAAFLVTYAVLAARRALRPQALASSDTPSADGEAKRGLTSALTTVLALTWLNPHVYLDIALIGSLASAQGSPLQWWFGAGAMLGSVIWFCSLGFGARFLRGFFARPKSWQILDGGIAVTMAALGTGLALGA